MAAQRAGLTQALALIGESMASNHKESVLAIVGYLTWFAILVRLLYLATNDQSSGAESLGLHLGVGLSLLALLGIPYFIVRIRAKRRGESVSWFLVMMWTTIIALLLAVGGFYGRLHTSAGATQAATNATPENQQPQPRAQAVPASQKNTEAQFRPQPSAAAEALPYEQRAWSGNVFDQFDSVQAIETKARSIAEINEQRAWAAVVAWQAAFMATDGKKANVALYMAVDTVLEGLKASRGVCRPGEIMTVSAEQANQSMPAGTQWIMDDCDRSP